MVTMPFLKMKSKISKDSLRGKKRVLGICKKPTSASKSPCSEPKISERIKHLVTATPSCHKNEQQNIGLDSSTRDVETNEPEDLLDEDNSQSQAYASPFDDSRSVEKMVVFFIGLDMRKFLFRLDIVQEIASNYASDMDTIFSPVLDDELYCETDRVCVAGNNVHWELPRWCADESSHNQSCDVSNFFLPDVLIASLPFYESGNVDVFTEISPLPRYIFPEPSVLLDAAEQYMLLPYLEDGSASSDDIKSDEDSRINVDKYDLFNAFNRSRSQNLEAAEAHAESEQTEDFDPQLFLRTQPELSDVVFNYFPDMQPRDSLKRKAVTLVLDLDGMI